MSQDSARDRSIFVQALINARFSPSGLHAILATPQPSDHLADGVDDAIDVPSVDVTEELLTQFASTQRFVKPPIAAVRIKGLEGLRAVLALMVFFYHFAAWQSAISARAANAPVGNFLHNMGYGSAALFFMISGFVFYPYLQKTFRESSWVPLFVNRFFRIYPLMLIVLVAVTAIILAEQGYVFHGTLSANLTAVAKWLMFDDVPDLYGRTHSSSIISSAIWSLKWEGLFYLSLPVLSFVCSIFNRKFALPVMLLLLCGEILALKYDAVKLPLALNDVLNFGALFLTGLNIHLVVENKWLARAFASPAFAVIGLASMIAEFSLFPDTDGPLQYLLLAAFVVSIVSGARYGGLLTNWAFRTLGDASYSLYMWHGVVLYLAFNWFQGFMINDLSADRWAKPWLHSTILGRYISPDYSWVALPLLTIIVVATAILSRALVERPFEALGKTLMAGAKKKARSATPVPSQTERF